MQFKTIPLARLINEPESATLKMIIIENANYAKDNPLLTLASMERQAPPLLEKLTSSNRFGLRVGIRDSVCQRSLGMRWGLELCFWVCARGCLLPPYFVAAWSSRLFMWVPSSRGSVVRHLPNLA